jgi:hypothetical protein
LSERDCYQVVRYFDSDKDAALNFKELMEVMLPCDNMYLRSSVTQRPAFNCPLDMKLHSTVEKKLSVLIELEIEYHNQIELQKFDLLRRHDWTDSFAY